MTAYSIPFMKSADSGLCVYQTNIRSSESYEIQSEIQSEPVFAPISTKYNPNGPLYYCVLLCTISVPCIPKLAIQVREADSSATPPPIGLWGRAWQSEAVHLFLRDFVIHILFSFNCVSRTVTAIGAASKIFDFFFRSFCTLTHSSPPW